ncbi:hypothetical protein [Catelliglobosispora koreensis]|uniref:hypothetical protein n=1 Tax=Catelliglobosispora koreensis TaxID=129052 RepID=UPI0012FAF165|nr:hypothetical protein [Catelliglobosispora koreensis]
MKLTTVTLVAPVDRPLSASTEVVADMLWAHSKPEEGFEHIRVAPGAIGIDISAFTRLSDSENSGDRLRALVERAIRANPALSDWQIL